MCSLIITIVTVRQRFRKNVIWRHKESIVKSKWLYSSIMVCFVFVLLSCSRDEGKASTLFQKANSLEQAGDVVLAQEMYKSITDLYPETETALKVPGVISRLKKEILRQKMSEVDAALGSIRTQLRVYYGENKDYPVRELSLVVDADWNDIKKGELTGKYFTDQLYWYKGDGSNYTITCRSDGILASDRSLDQSGKLRGGN